MIASRAARRSKRHTDEQAIAIACRQHAARHAIEQAADSNSNNNMLITIAIIIINTKLLLTGCKMQIRIFVPTLARIALLYLLQILR